MAANARNASRATLTRFGFNAETILDLDTVQEEDLDKLPKHLKACWRDTAAAPPNNQVRVPPFISLKKLKAMCYWVLAQHCISMQNPCAQDFTQVVFDETLARMQADKDYKLVTEDMDIQKPEKLTDLVKWTKFGSCSVCLLGG
jgi:hypothetical protein